LASYWLTPVNGEDPLVLGEDRLLMPAGPLLEDFRGKLHQGAHPRFLPMVKAAILPGDDHESAGAVCGSESSPSFAEQGDVVFDGAPYTLSECGRAFIDRLPHLREQEEWLRRVQLTAEADGWTELETGWLQFISIYVRSGRRVMLVKEE